MRSSFHDEIKSSFKAVFTRAIFLDDFLYMHLHIIVCMCMYIFSVLFTRCESHVYLHSSIIIWVKRTLGKGWCLSGLKYEKKYILVISRGAKNKTIYSNNSQIYKNIKKSEEYGKAACGAGSKYGWGHESVRMGVEK